VSASRRPQRVAEILHVDAEVLAVDKPAGVLAGPGTSDQAGVPELLSGKGGLPEDERFEVTHRLDEHASGVVVYARSVAGKRELRAQFADGRAQTTYLALVSGYVQADGEIDLSLYYNKRAGLTMASERRGTPATTHYRIVERVAGNTWLECRPLCERTGQLRAHLAAIGHPLTVDLAYGGGDRVLLSDYKPGYRPSARREERPLIDRLTLHAASVSLVHPASGAELRCEAPLPRDMRATLKQLGRWR